MGTLYRYEWKKLLRQRSFLLFTAVLLCGNLLMLFQYEKKTDAYTYFYKQKQEWQKYNKGDETIQQAEVYQAFVETEKIYVSSYKDFLKQIPEQAEKLKGTVNYQDQDTYLYRDLIKTVSDYAGLFSKRVKAEPSVGIKELASYNYGIYFQWIYIFVLSYFVISAERKEGLFLLTKGTKQGHLPFAAAKVLTMVSASALYGFLQECSTFFLLGYFYGYGDVTRSVQSISIFRDCSVPITVAQALVGLLGIRIAIGIFCTVLLACITICLRKEGVGLFFYGIFIGMEMFWDYSIQMSSSLNIIKCVNVFFAWDMKHIFGTYQNLNIFEYPVSKSMLTLVVASVFVCMFTAVALFRFSVGCQISSGNLLEEIRERISKRTCFVWHHTSVFRFEFRKVFVQQKRGFLLLFLLVWCMVSVKDAMEPTYYDDPALGEYHRILSEISGPVTDETLTYISNQRAEMDAIYEELEELKQESDQQVEAKKQALWHEVEMRDGGISLVEEQRDLLLEKDGDIFHKFWIDEKKYTSAFYNYKYDLTVFLIAAIVLILWMSDIEAWDNRKGMYSILYTTKVGKRRIQRKKKMVCIAGMYLCAIGALLPQILRYYSIDQFQNAAQKLSDITSMGIHTSMRLGIFMLLLCLAKIAAFVLTCRLLVMLIRKVPNTSIVIGVGVGSIGLVVLLLWYFHMDLAILFLRMFCL